MTGSQRAAWQLGVVMARGVIGGVIRLVVAGGLTTVATAFATAGTASADWLSDERALSSDSTFQNSPALSGRKLVYADYRDERSTQDGEDPDVLYDIRVRDVVTGADRSITPEPTAIGAPAISGYRVVWPDYGDGSTTGGIWYHNLSTGAQHRLPVAGGSGLEIDGTRLCYERDNRIHVYDLSKRTERAVSPEGARAGSCDISGRTVVWHQEREGAGLDIYSKDLATGRETRLTSDPADQSLPRISGHRVVWQDQRNGDDDIYGYDLSNGAEFRISGAEGRQWFADISGDRVVWMDERHGRDNSEIYLFDLATGVETRVTNQPGWSGNPTISGDRIAYEDNHAGRHDLYLRRITPPRITLEVAQPVVAGTGAAVSGRLVGADGTEVAGETVLLEYSTDGREWRAAGRTVTKPGGEFTASTPMLTETVSLRARFAGSLEYPPVVSDETEVQVRIIRLRGVELR